MSNVLQLNAKLTEVGFQKALSIEGVALKIKEVAIGDANGSGYTVAYRDSKTELVNEIARKQIASHRVNDNSGSVDLATLFDGDQTVDIWELGFFDEDGDLVLIWSDPETIFASKLGHVQLAVSVALHIIDLGLEQISIVDAGYDFELFLSGVYEQLDGIEPHPDTHSAAMINETATRKFVTGEQQAVITNIASQQGKVITFQTRFLVENENTSQLEVDLHNGENIFEFENVIPSAANLFLLDVLDGDNQPILGSWKEGNQNMTPPIVLSSYYYSGGYPYSDRWIYPDHLLGVRGKIRVYLNEEQGRLISLSIDDYARYGENLEYGIFTQWTAPNPINPKKFRFRWGGTGINFKPGSSITHYSKGGLIDG